MVSSKGMANASRPASMVEEVSPEQASAAESLYHCFLVRLYLEQQQGGKALKLLQGLALIFPNSQHLAIEIALAHYENSRDYDQVLLFPLYASNENPPTEVTRMPRPRLRSRACGRWILTA